MAIRSPFTKRYSAAHSPPEATATVPAIENLIELRNVIKSYDTPVGPYVALKNASLTVKPGEFVAVIGKSGSGKSTLINMLTGIDRPTSGEIYVAGTAVHTLDEGQMAVWRGQHLGIIFQFFQLLPTLTLLENVILPMEFARLYTPAERKARAMDLLDRVDVAQHAYKYPTAISGGQQQRVAIARALANDPAVLVADEPTGNLDSKTADAVFGIFEKFAAQGRTILMVTHDNDLAGRASRVVLLADGEIAEAPMEHALPALDQKQMVNLAARLDPVHFAPGEIVFRQGDPADKLYIIIRGEVEVILEHPDGQHTISATMGPGQYFGELGLLNNQPRSATIRVTRADEATLLALDREVFQQLMAESETTHRDMLEMMRQRRTINEIVRMATAPSEAAQLQRTDYIVTTVQPGETIYQQGDLADRIYYISRGAVEIVAPHEAGKPFARLETGQYFGVEGLDTPDSKRMQTVRAAADRTEPIQVVSIEREKFRSLVHDNQIVLDDLALTQQKELRARA